MASPDPLTPKAVGKASRWGCYVPGPGESVYTVTTGVELLISRNSSPCLAWKPLDPSIAPTSPIVFGGSRVCRVSHDGVFHDVPGVARSTTGERIGQVRMEGGVWVCRYEFYFNELNKTLINNPSETTDVLDFAP
jgi:hypothetical protein